MLPRNDTIYFVVLTSSSEGSWLLHLIRRLGLCQAGPGGIGHDPTNRFLMAALSTSKERTIQFRPAVVICSVEADQEVLEATLQAGSIAYVFKARIQKELVLAAKSALQRKAFVLEVRK
jgi:DNA-binding NarL/FixJ family response regulator